MTGTDRLMVGSDSAEGLRAALAKAARLQTHGGQGLLVVRTCYDSLADEPAEVLTPRHRQHLADATTRAAEEELAVLAEPLRERLPDLETRVIWTRDAADALVDAAGRWHAQVLVKPLSRPGDGPHLLHTPLDWALMRESPCPVLISRDSTWDGGCVLAAVDAADESHAPLNREILARAAGLAGSLGGTLHVVCAYPDLGQRVDQLQVADDFRGIKSDMKRTREQRIRNMLQSLGTPVADIHVEEGQAMHVIPALARRLDCAVTVLGTAARRGVGKLVMGNTAEDLVGHLPTDLMTVRAPWS